MVDSCRTCPNCREGLEQYCDNELTLTYNSPDRKSGGVVSIAFGGNSGLGGKNQPVAGGWVVPLLKATVEADGKVIVRDGKLVL